MTNAVIFLMWSTAIALVMYLLSFLGVKAANPNKENFDKEWRTNRHLLRYGILFVWVVFNGFTIGAGLNKPEAPSGLISYKSEHREPSEIDTDLLVNEIIKPKEDAAQGLKEDINQAILEAKESRSIN